MKGAEATLQGDKLEVGGEKVKSVGVGRIKCSLNLEVKSRKEEIGVGR